MLCFVWARLGDVRLFDSPRDAPRSRSYPYQLPFHAPYPPHPTQHAHHHPPLLQPEELFRTVVPTVNAWRQRQYDKQQVPSDPSGSLLFCPLCTTILVLSTSSLPPPPQHTRIPCSVFQTRLQIRAALAEASSSVYTSGTKSGPKDRTTAQSLQSMISAAREGKVAVEPSRLDRKSAGSSAASLTSGGDAGEEGEGVFHRAAWSPSQLEGGSLSGTQCVHECGTFSSHSHPWEGGGVRSSHNATLKPPGPGHSSCSLRLLCNRGPTEP